jgi:hypothetical protein
VVKIVSKYGGQPVETIRKKYIVDEQDKKIAVQIPIKVFDQIEQLLENYGLVQLMKENEGEETLSLHEAKAYYNQLEKVQ